MANLTDEQKQKLEAIKAKYKKPADARPMAAGKAPEAEGPVVTPSATAAPPAVVTPAAPEEKDNVVALVPCVTPPPAPVAPPVAAPPAKTPETETAATTSDTDVTKPKLALVPPPASEEEAEAPAAADEPTTKFSAEATRKVSMTEPETAAPDASTAATDSDDLLAGWDISPDEVAAAVAPVAAPLVAPPPPAPVVAPPASVAPLVAAPPVTAPSVPGAAVTAKYSIVLSQIGPDGSEIKEFAMAQDIIKIGKLASSHLRLDAEDVSRMHAVIECTHGDCRIIDLGSSTGTIVNGTKALRAKLNKGDTIQIGSVTLKVKEIKSLTPTAAPPVAEIIPQPVIMAPPPIDFEPLPPPPPVVAAPPKRDEMPPAAVVPPKVKAAPRVAKPIGELEGETRPTSSDIIPAVKAERRRKFLARAGLVVVGGALVGLLGFGLRGGCNCGPHKAATPPVVAQQEDAGPSVDNDGEVQRRLREAMNRKAATKAPPAEKKAPKVKKAVRPPKVVKVPEKKAEERKPIRAKEASEKDEGTKKKNRNFRDRHEED